MATISGNVPAGRGASDQESATGLLSRLVDDAMALARNELALAKSELRSALQDMKMGLASLAVAALVVLAGLLTLVAAAVIALAHVVPWWLSALIIGAALALVGVLMLQTARHKLANPGAKLDQAQESLQRDATVVARRT